ncbi:virulence RhuM family protein [Billgrantia endophytica]|nr:virulence RhuM family protein [Halomonas endophytica]
MSRAVDFYNLDTIISVGYQNKLHYAIHGHTAAELIRNRMAAICS